jgi:hypothetical protein
MGIANDLSDCQETAKESWFYHKSFPGAQCGAPP